MSQSDNRRLAAEAFHFAKLALFNVRLMNDLQGLAPHSREVAAAIESRARADNVSLPVPLVNQATFVQLGYICLVWLWELSKAEENAATILGEVERRFNFESACASKSGERVVEAPEHVVRLVRNALSHGRVAAEHEHFIFSDKSPREAAPTSIRLTWPEFGQLCEAVLFSVNASVYPDSVLANA